MTAYRSVAKGILIVFEGIDGSGKSTQLNLLGDALKAEGRPVITTREPTEGTYGRQIRGLYENRKTISREEELDLFLKDRREHVCELLAPSLAEKKIILCDRYFLSTIAYQGAAGLDPLHIAKLNSFAPEPDLALLFQIPAEVSIERILEKRKENLNDFEQKENLLKVARIFDTLGYPYIRRIDACRDMTIVHNEVLSLVKNYLQAFSL